MSAEHRTAYRPDIDGLRAVSIVAVVLFHAFPSLLPGGFVGVDVFFVISGYLISGIILADLRQGGFSYLNFYFARFRRIVPALFVVLLSTFAFGFIVLMPDEYVSLGRHLAAGAAFTSNMRMLHDIGYFDLAADLKPLLHLWSLGVEEQFYIFWPLILTLLLRLRIRMLPALLALFVASFVSMEMMTPMRAFYLLPARFWELMVGGVLACVQADHISFSPIPQRHRSRAALTGAAMALVLLLISVLGFTPASPYPGWRALLPTLAAGLLIAAGAQSWINRHVLGNRVAVWIGVISYPLYLWHWPLLSFARIIAVDEPPAWVRAALVGVAVGLAWLSWKCVELPVRRSLFAQLSARRRRFAVIGLALACLGLVYAVGDNAAHPNAWSILRPLQDRLETQEIGQDLFERYIRAHATKYDGCPDFGTSSDQRCWVRPDHQAVQSVLWGDSHAEHFIPGLFDHVPESRNWMIATAPGCPPVLHLVISFNGVDSGCAAFNTAMMAYFASHQDIKLVALSWRANAYLPPDTGQDIHLANHPGDITQTFPIGLTETIARLESMGKHVVVLIDAPEPSFDVHTCLRSSVQKDIFDIPEKCDSNRNSIESKIQKYKNSIAYAKNYNHSLLIFDNTNRFCTDELCKFMLNGHVVFRDNNGHLSITGSRLMANDFFDWLNLQ